MVPSANTQTHPPDVKLSHIRSVAVDFAAESVVFNDVFHASRDWAAFARSLSSLPALHQVTFGFMSHEDMARFVTEVVEKIAPLKKEGKVKYALRQPWDKYRLSPWLHVSEKLDWVKSK